MDFALNQIATTMDAALLAPCSQNRTVHSRMTAKDPENWILLGLSEAEVLPSYVMPSIKSNICKFNTNSMFYIIKTKR